MSLRALVALTIVLSAEPAAAQRIAPRVEVFTTIGGVAGITRMSIDGLPHTGVHAGFRGDAGIQGESLALALGGRVWELSPTRQFGGHGLDVFVTTEWRVSWDTRSTVRASVGGGFDDIDGGHGPERNGVGASGVMFSLGAAREVIAPSDARVILSADIVMPSVNTDISGRRRPILEVGFGYRFRDYSPIAAVPSR